MNDLLAVLTVFSLIALAFTWALWNVWRRVRLERLMDESSARLIEACDRKDTAAMNRELKLQKQILARLAP